jgi:hypothetical protein
MGLYQGWGEVGGDTRLAANQLGPSQCVVYRRVRLWFQAALVKAHTYCPW